MSDGRRGAKAVTARDWLFGSRPRRLILRFLLRNPAPPEGWTKAQIATACDLSANGGATHNVDGLVALGLLYEENGRYRPVGLEVALLARVAAVLDELESVPEIPIEALLAARDGTPPWPAGNSPQCSKPVEN
jgi:hypothetical protein